LRIEDTDRERSTAASTQAILDAMAWLKLDYDEGPFYQMQRLERYRAVAQQLVKQGHAYHCYASKEELDAMREQQRARGEKPRYDGRWRPENAKGKTPPSGVEPLIRFRNPDDGDVAWRDLVKGDITFSNTELDDLVMLRADGVPTYNFGVVVDDIDMQMTHVIRGDDHVNNTPRQINIFKALGATLPHFAHVPMILGPDGERLSKRHGAVSVMQYEEEGYLPAALNNYLARLGWSHGDEEVFSMPQFVAWFDLEHISRSPAQFNPEKLLWLNQQYLKAEDSATLGAALARRLPAHAVHGPFDAAKLAAAAELLKPRASTLVELAEAALYFFRPVQASAELRAQHLSDAARSALRELAEGLERIEWRREDISRAIKEVLTARKLKMPELAIPLRVAVCGTPHTPPIDATLELIGQAEVLERLRRALAAPSPGAVA
jgi:glutamyl-tRNA synthetase